MIGRWRSLGPTPIELGLGATGRIMSLALDADVPARMYAASLSAGRDTGGTGVWRTADGGATWRPIGDALPGLKVSALALPPGRSAPLYATVLDSGVAGGGLYRSDDQGDSWDLVVVDARLTGRKLLIDPGTPSRMFMSTGPAVLRSRDGGASWNDVLTPSGGTVSDLAIHPTRPSRLLASVVHETSDTVAGLYETRDSGDNWRKLLGCPGGRLPTAGGWRRIMLAMAPARTYVSFQSPDEFFVYRTTGIGCSIGGRSEQTWERGWSAGSDVAPSIFSFLYVHPADPDVVYATGVQFRRSTDGAGTFSISRGPHVDHHAMAFDPDEPDVVYTGCDGGIYRSDDRGATDSWTFVGTDMANTEFYDLAHAPTDPNVLIGGTQDNGTIKWRPGTTRWSHIRGGDGATCDVDPTNESILYSMGQYASSIARQVDGGAWAGLSRGLPEGSECFNLHFQVHPGTPTTMLASCRQLWRTTTTVPPGDWKPIFPPDGFPTVPGNVVRSALDARSDIYYAATTRGQVYAGVGGQDWQLVFDMAVECDSESTSIADIEVDAEDPSVVYLATTGVGACRVVRLERETPSGLELTPHDITADLPEDVRVRCLALDRLRPGIVYVGTRTRGVHRGRFVGRARWTWDPYNDGLPSAAGVVRLLAHPITGILRAATMGRGAYEVDTDHPIGSVVAATGVVSFLRVHDAGGFGPPEDRLDGHVVFRLDTEPRKAFGIVLHSRTPDRTSGMLDLLRSALIHQRRTRVEYVRTGLRNGRAIRIELVE